MQTFHQYLFDYNSVALAIYFRIFELNEKQKQLQTVFLLFFLFLSFFDNKRIHITD